MPQNTRDAAKDIIYRKIRTEIITGKKKPGERLSIDLLKKQFGTSVTPVRDALQMLSQEELVTIKPRSGYYVTLITLKELNDMMDLRSILEMASAALAAERITDEQVAQLETVHAGYTDDCDESTARYTEENKKFHYLVAQASGNHELALQVAHIHDRLARFVVMSTTGKKIAHTHSILIERLKAHDAAGAQKAMKKEIDDGRKLMMDRIMQEEANYWHLGATGKPEN